MEHTSAKRFLSAVMAFVMLLSLLPAGGLNVFAEETTTVWDFSAEDFVALEDNSYNGLSWTNGRPHNNAYLYSGTGTVSVPVSGPCDITVAACYEYSFYFESETEASVGVKTGSTNQIDTYTYSYSGEAGTVDITVLGGSYLTSVTVAPQAEGEQELATEWYFNAEDFVALEGTGYNGLTWTNGRPHGNTYLYSGAGTVSVPVAGPCDITVSACYEYSFYFESETEASVGVKTGSTGQIDPYTYSYSGEAGTVDITVLGTSYLNSIVVVPKEVIDVPELDTSLIDVWDFGAEQLDSAKYNNMLDEDEINSWFPDKEPGTEGVALLGFTSTDGQLVFEANGKTNNRLRTTNTNLCRHDQKSLTDASGNVYTGYVYSNSSSTSAVYLSVLAYAGDIVTLVVGSNGGNSTINFEAPSGSVVKQVYDASGAKAQSMTFYAAETGMYKMYSTDEKLVVARIYREHTAAVAVTGTVSAPESLSGYSVVFTNDQNGGVVKAPVSDGSYSVTLNDCYTYTLSLADANGYVITSDAALSVEKGAQNVVCNVTVEQVDLVTVTGSITGLNGEALAKAELSFVADAIYVPEITVSGSSYTAILEKGVTYAVAVGGVNDYVLTSEASVCYDADTAADITLEAKPVYAVTVAPEGATAADLAGATFTFTNLNEEGYVYSFTGTEGIVLRDGVYSVKVTNSGAYVQQLTSNVKVEGAAVTKAIPFSSSITVWDFSAEDFTGEGGSYNTLTWTNAVKNKTYLLAKDGTISVPVSGSCRIAVSACYQYSFYFASEDEGSVGQKTGSTSQIDVFTYDYTGEAGTVDITVLGQSYITKIEIIEVVEYKDTVTVGTSGCDYTTINDALDAVRAMERPNNERVTIAIQPGNYEEMLVIDVPNVSLVNASSAPSLALTNKGVDIDANAVRITSYYGHGYTYYSMGSDCKYDETILQVNKENGYASFTNPGTGTTAGSYWNATVVICASGFRAEGIIFENSFNQYVSAKAANDVIVAQSSAQEGATPRADLPVGSTAVQDKAYVERAAALAIANNVSEAYFENCKFIGRQDTLYGGTGTTAAFYDCSVYGACDYIFGGMTAVFAKCDLVFNTSENGNDVGYITAAQTPSGSHGLLMYNCTVTSTTPGVDTASEYTSKPGYFGRPWAASTGEAVFYNTVIEASDTNWYEISPSLIRSAGWLSTLSGESALCGEYGTYEYAKDVDNSASRASWAAVFETEYLASGEPITIETWLGDWDAFAGKDLTIVIPTEKVDNAPKEEENEPSAGEPTEYTFDSLVDVTPGKDKDAIAAGTTYADGYFKVVGTVTQRYSESKGGVYAVEIAKNGTGALEFTVTGSADVTITVASTGGSNTSAVALIDAEGNVIANNEVISEVTGTAATTLTWTGLEAGTYQIVSPQSDYNRGFRLMTVNVVEVPAVVITEYTFDSLVDVTPGKDKDAIAAGTTYADGYFKVVGTVTQRYSESKGGVYAVEIAKNGTGALEFTVTGSADVTITVASTGGSNTSAVALIDAEGNVIANNEVISEVTGTAATTLTWTGLEAGTYQIVSPQSDYNRGFRLMTVDVVQTASGERPARLDWAQVADPVIVEAKQNGGSIDVTWGMVIGYDGADSVTVTLKDGSGNVIDTKSVADTGNGGSVSFQPTASGSYAVWITASRADEADKTGAGMAVEDFLLPLSAPTIASATSLGGGKVNLIWDSVAEAESYNVYCDGTLVANVTANDYTVSGLTVGTKYTFTLEAVRGSEVSAASAAVAATATEDAQAVWSFLSYGPSTGDSKNGYTGSINEDGKVTVYATSSGGKIQLKDVDGLSYYYTAVPADKNFTFRATLTVDEWTYTNGQEGFGLLAMDTVPAHGDYTHWTNQYMAMLGKVEYFYDFANNEIVNEANDYTIKYSMKLGLGVASKLGITPENLDKILSNDTDTILKVASGITYPLELSAAQQNLPKGTYNIVGNVTNTDALAAGAESIADLTTFTLEIQKNNTGYFITYYDAEGNILGQQKNYDPTALQQLDTENVYVGFFVARNGKITFSDVTLTTIDPSEDAPAEEKPVTYITPSCMVVSPMVANDPDYTLSLNANVAGTASVSIDGAAPVEYSVSGDGRCDIPVTLTKTGTTKIEIEFCPDPDQDLGEDVKLANSDPIITSVNVTYVTDYANQKNLYVSPNGKSTATGYYQDPIDIYTAVSVVQPGQTIVLLEGTYSLTQNVFIARGIDGTADSPIRMIADPNAATRPVLDFSGANGVEGITLVGSYWYMQGFDVVNTPNGKAGIHVAGHYNTLDLVNAYDNGGTGIQISRYAGSDLKSEWPSYNLILNCTAYNNADSGYEDADGFGAKLTIGEGNVFDGCIAYHNADDGWDLYAKVETGAIGSVTIRNCVAYENGYVEGENGELINAGNGNGFKMGGSNIPGAHKIINSYSFFNKAKGFDSNSCPDIIVENCIAYNNESYNIAFYTNITQNTAFVGKGIISFKDSTGRSGLSTGESLKPKGNQLDGDANIWNETNYYWDGSQSVNTAGAQVTSDWFVSLEFKGVQRNADGTIHMNGFLELTEAAASNAGARPDGAETPEQSVGLDNPFTDVGEGNRFKPAILWGYYNDILSGTTVTTFAPNANVTRAQFVMFLWRAAGCPEPASDENPFTDVSSGNRFYKAILWAYHADIAYGTTTTTFAPGDSCTRGQVILFLYRYAGRPDVSGLENPFTDISENNRYYDAVVWAYHNNITSGYTDNTFRIGSECIRAHVIQFLYNYETKK